MVKVTLPLLPGSGKKIMISAATSEGLKFKSLWQRLSGSSLPHLNTLFNIQSKEVLDKTGCKFITDQGHTMLCSLIIWLTTGKSLHCFSVT